MGKGASVYDTQDAVGCRRSPPPPSSASRKAAGERGKNYRLALYLSSFHYFPNRFTLFSKLFRLFTSLSAIDKCNLKR